MYFGEKLAFFFAWKSFLTIAMAIIGIPGGIIQLIVLSSNNYDHDILIFWVIYVVIICTFMVEFWKRISYEILTRWGLLEEVNLNKDGT